MAVKEGKENVKRWRRKKVSEKGCDTKIFKPERNIKVTLKLIRVE